MSRRHTSAWRMGFDERDQWSEASTLVLCKSLPVQSHFPCPPPAVMQVLRSLLIGKRTIQRDSYRSNVQVHGCVLICYNPCDRRVRPRFRLPFPPMLLFLQAVRRWSVHLLRAQVATCMNEGVQKWTRSRVSACGSSDRRRLAYGVFRFSPYSANTFFIVQFRNNA